MQNNMNLIQSICGNLDRLKSFTTGHTSSNSTEFLIHYNRAIYRISLLGEQGEPSSRQTLVHLSKSRHQNNSSFVHQLIRHLALFKDVHISSLADMQETIYKLTRKLGIFSDFDTAFLEQNQNEFILEFEEEAYLVATTRVGEVGELTFEHVDNFLK